MRIIKSWDIAPPVLPPERGFGERRGGYTQAEAKAKQLGEAWRERRARQGLVRNARVGTPARIDALNSVNRSNAIVSGLTRILRELIP